MYVVTILDSRHGCWNTSLLYTPPRIYQPGTTHTA